VNLFIYLFIYYFFNFDLVDFSLQNVEPMWQLGLGSSAGGGGEDSYPLRPDEIDCTYYLRTGFCGFGSRCRFNHPRDRGAVIKAFFLSI
jgi:hypothetical protein